MSIANQKPFIIVRHGDTAFTEAKKIHGMIDIGINQHGRQEIEKMSSELAKYNPNIIYTSKLKRCQQTSQILSKNLGLPVKIDESLDTMDFGDYSGDERDKVMKMLFSQAKMSPDQPFPNGESFNSWKERLLSGVNQLLKNNPEERPILVTHSICIDMIDAWLKAGATNELTFNMQTFIKHTENPGSYEKKLITVA